MIRKTKTPEHPWDIPAEKQDANHPAGSVANSGQRPGHAQVDEYIAGFPAAVQESLSQLRATIKTAAPDAEETISYQMPTYKLAGNLVHFAAYKNHIGFYPGSGGILHFEDELSVFEGSKGTVRFPIDQPLPLRLIAGIVKFRVDVNLEKAKAKRTS
jgi:uncharacterized protein YdhG (YjbR/CyaY superfamily)